ncbi:MAG TPA: hypothetical protein GX504_11030 [Clostridia bacterium]|nr:hypothetical protein [Clostridia bacterium]
MEIKQYPCLGCAKGCSIQVELERGRVDRIQGYGCQKGKELALAFVTMD